MTDQLERDLEELLDVESFPPPEEFAERRRSPTPRSTRRSRPTGRCSGRRQAGALDWAERWDTVLDDSEPAVLQVVHRRQAERLAQLPRPPCRGRAAATASRSTGAARRARSATSPTPTCSPTSSASPTCCKDRGVEAGRRRRDLPADDPRGRRRDAGVRADRRAAQRRLRRLLARSRCASGWSSPTPRLLITADGARRKGKSAPVKADVDAQMRRVAVHRRAPHAGDRLPDGRRARRLVRRGDGGRRRRVPGRAVRRRAPAVHPLHVRLDRQAEGDPAHARAAT